MTIYERFQMFYLLNIDSSVCVNNKEIELLKIS